MQIESLRPHRNLVVGAQRHSRCGEMRVGEEVAESGSGDELLGAGTFLGRGPPASWQRRPCTARAVRTLGEPAPSRRSPEQALVLRATQKELQTHALVPSEQRQEPMCRRPADDL